MSIPKRLILYRAPRHQESLPLNIKQGYYSHKISISPPTKTRKQHVNFHRRYQKKFAQEVSLKIYDSVPKANDALAILPKISHIKKFRIEPADQVHKERSIKSMAKVFQKAFMVLKRIKKLTIGLSGNPQERAQTSKTLLRLPNLESLTLPNFSYSEKSKTPKLFIKAAKSASKRKGWPHLKSLNIQLEPPILRDSSPKNDGIFTRSLKLLLEFMRGLESCQEIYKISAFELKLSTWASFNTEQANLLTEIAKVTPSLISLKGCEANGFSALSGHSQQLKRVALDLNGKLSTLNQIDKIQELTLLGIFFQKDFFTQISSIKNLTNLSIGFLQMPTPSDNEALVLAEMISDLANLRSLEFDFSERIHFGGGSKAEVYVWLNEVLQAIGKKSKLEELYLNFSGLDFPKSQLVFDNLSQNLENLVNLSHFKLHIEQADALEDKDMLRFGRCLSKLPRIQELSLRFTKDISFSKETFFALIDYVVKSLPLLSRFELMASKIEVDKEVGMKLSKEINKMRCLNWVSFDFQGGNIKSDVGLRNLAAEIRKRRAGGVEYFNTDKGSTVLF